MQHFFVPIIGLIIFSIMALASLSAGIFFTLTSWKIMNLICIPFLVLILYSTFRAEKMNRNKTSA